MKSIALFSTSTRLGSYNQKLIDLAAIKLIEMGGIQAERINLADYELPLFQPDLSLPQRLTDLYEKLSACEGWVISTCEYNHSFSPLIKNTIDWLSLVGKGVRPSLFLHKKIWMMSASPGSFGAIKSVGQLHSVLWQLGAQVLPAPLSIPHAHQAFDENGFLKEESYSSRMDKGLLSLLQTMGEK